ncbi:MAG: Holliday junction DNA helicase RuvA [Phycisphaerae bacterium]|nr:Holliday junction DNA helicase RuvA [Phycisphaerae bacterium]
MIARITGRLEEITTSSVLIDTGDGLWYEVLIPVSDIDRLSAKLGSDIILHTIHHIEGDPSRGQVIPRLIGFLSEADREFFKAFTKVKGIGARKALRALARPAAEIAAAIENKDDKMLVSLPEIGKRTAEQIIAELHGKLAKFAGDLSAGASAKSQLPEPALEAISALVQLGEKHTDASALVERVLAVAPELQSAEEIIQQVYKLKAGNV